MSNFHTLKKLVFIFLLTTVFADEKFLIRQTPTISAPNFVLMDADTGLILAERCAHCKVPPASITKLIPLYILSEALHKGNVKKEDLVTVSQKAAKAPGSRMFVNPSSKVSIENLMNGMIVSSGNDATFAISEYLGGNEQSFVQMMNELAEKFQMKDTHFANSTGLPDKEQFSSAYDLAHLTRRLIQDFPEFYPKYSQKYFSFNKIKQHNRNALLWADDRIDGVKTGFTNDAGYCLVSSAKQNDLRLIAVILGSKTEKSRKIDSLNLLNYGFRFFKVKEVESKALSTAHVWYGRKPVEIGLKDNINVITPRFNDEEIKIKLEVKSSLKAPIHKGDTLGKMTFMYRNQIINQKELVALNEVKEKFILFRFFDNLQIGWHNLLHKDKI